MAQSALDYFDLLELFAAMSWLFKANWSNQVTLGLAVMPNKVYLASAFGFSLRSIVFGALLSFWTLWLFESLYVYLDRLI